MSERTLSTSVVRLFALTDRSSREPQDQPHARGTSRSLPKEQRTICRCIFSMSACSLILEQRYQRRIATKSGWSRAPLCKHWFHDN
ncbi:hypothetical protein T4E_10146 [Trichinella pseudospiralis]|uniref:Uncharacterized protein n=1 Tax=Trichinella pseudospiralis TaxID=6337 RepID=A0A0V0YLK3_TRIPS|nr:hypothetical protein T4E_10146 [Trichinella pseudospiralis]